MISNIYIILFGGHMADDNKTVTGREAGSITEATGLHEGLPGPNPRVDVSENGQGACKVVVHSDNKATNTYSKLPDGSLEVVKERIPSKFVPTLDEGSGETQQGRSPADSGYKELQKYRFEKDGKATSTYELSKKGKEGAITDQGVAESGLSSMGLTFIDPSIAKEPQHLEDVKREAREVLKRGCKPPPMM
jgi:hypothetical protein